MKVGVIKSSRHGLFIGGTYQRPAVEASSRSANGSLPPEQKEVVAAKRTAVGQKEPEESFLDGVPDANASEFDRLAMRTVAGQHRFTLASFLSCLSQFLRRAAFLAWMAWYLESWPIIRLT